MPLFSLLIWTAGITLGLFFHPPCQRVSRPTKGNLQAYKGEPTFQPPSISCTTGKIGFRAYKQFHVQPLIKSLSSNFTQMKRKYDVEILLYFTSYLTWYGACLNNNTLIRFSKMTGQNCSLREKKKKEAYICLWSTPKTKWSKLFICCYFYWIGKKKTSTYWKYAFINHSYPCGHNDEFLIIVTLVLGLRPMKESHVVFCPHEISDPEIQFPKGKIRPSLQIWLHMYKTLQ